MRHFVAAAACLAALTIPHAFAQSPCRGTTLTGTVRDSTLALIPGAALTLDGGQSTVGGSDGKFRFACVEVGPHRILAAAEGFAKAEVSFTAPHAAPLDVVLPLEVVQTDVAVSGESSGSATSANASGPSTTVSGSRLQALADDPDDLLRELQQLAAAGGGNPANTTIAVDGFQGSSNLPPKSSIAYIKIDPDQFAAEYREPPFDGGRVEVYTKPGQKDFHGALFATNGSPWENARDPFSTSRAALGKERYGFELTGPARPGFRNGAGSDFSVTLEHRSIDNFAAIDAFTLDSGGNTVNSTGNVATPQRLWLATARLDWQLGAKNTFIASYSANVNHLENVGVGGTSLAATGYASEKYEHMFRLSNITTVSAHRMHEARLSLRWDGETDTPASNATQVQVAGSFTGGGADIGPKQLHELNVEFDDDAILTTKNHAFKFGTQMMIYDEHQQLTTNFNGTYAFGGGTAPVLDANNHPVAGQTETITGIEQYRRSLLGFAGGTPTAYSNVAGNPTVDFTQVTDALFYEDDWNPGHNLHVAYGVRYYIQNDPTLLSSMVPRLGILWSPTKKGTWTLHAHAGLFSGRMSESVEAEVLREDGIERVTRTVYNPVYDNPFAGATPIESVRKFSGHIGNLTWAGENIGGTRTLPFGLNLSADYYIGRIWNYTRSENINSPLNGVPTGPRPGAPNLDLLETQASGQGRVSATFVGFEDHALKRAQFFLGSVRVELVDDTDDDEFFTPQSSTSDAGEYAHRTGQTAWNVFGNGTFTLPLNLKLSADFNAGGDSHYNITTGFDNNGDGDFNDRPQYAPAGTPLCSANPNPSPCGYATRYGVLVMSGGTGVFPRNKGVLPWTIHLDTNLERAFALTHKPKAEHPQTLTVNLRSSNVLNHLNVTAIGQVLGSPLFGVPYAADNGRRIEAGVRYSF
jgi:hypothetical protein